MDLGYFRLNKLSFNRKRYLKLYQFLILPPEYISSKPGPNQYLQGNDNKFEPFHKLGLHFLHINVKSLL